jgi:ribosomal protein S18 acetylase RimI-like enzyme
MTTTLRPTGPQRRAADGARSRDYTVCVNSRAVGGLVLRSDPTPGRAAGAPHAVGRIEALTIDEADRKRGRGTVAALAAEEVLRMWGCERVEIAVPAEAEHGLRIATALGYTERNRYMLKQLDGDPRQLPPGVTLRRPSAEEHRWWAERDRGDYVRTLTGAGVPRAEAEAREAAAFAREMPEGGAAEGSGLHAMEYGGGTVGWLLLRTAPEPGWVLSVEIEAAHRGNGLGRTLMLAAEEICREAGTEALGLNVFTANTPAVRLYTSLGYLITGQHLYKSLV